MKNKLFLLTVVLAQIVTYGCCYAAGSETIAPQLIITQDDMFEENPDENVQDFFTIDIRPPKKTFSFRDIPLYTRLLFSYLFENRIRPAYYALLGYVIRTESKIETKR